MSFARPLLLLLLIPIALLQRAQAAEARGA